MTYLTPEEISAVELPKWPGCDVTGNPVTKEQAMEILVRTNGTYFSTNDREFEKVVKSIYFTAIPKPEWGDEWWVTPDYQQTKDMPTEERGKLLRGYWERESIYHKEMGVLGIEYLTNQRVCSCYIGGPHGWCDWSGNIHQRGKNIGKWPSAMYVFNEWATIAEAFPFLRLTCHLLKDEAGYEEGPDSVIAIVYEVEGGKVRARLPRDGDNAFVTRSTDESDVDIFISRLNNPFAERGTTPSEWQAACQLVAKKFSQVQLP